MQDDSTLAPRKKPSGAQNRRRRVALGGPRNTAGDVRYEAKPSRIRAHTIAARVSDRRMRDWVTSIKLERGCVDCGYNAHPAALHFDHLPGVEKTAGIAKLIGRIGREPMLAEIAKCEVVCANCHAVRTAERRPALRRYEAMPFATD